MRSKNLLPLQVVMPSSWMGANQSSHKVAFEEALHNSIENSLRSPSVTPSAVFSSLFFTYRPSSINASDVKPSITELNHDVSRLNSNLPAQSEPSNLAAPSSYMQPARLLQNAGIENRGSPALHTVASVEDVQRPQVSERKNIHNDNRPPLPSTQPQVPMLTQQQQIEIQQARLEQFKQLQKLQAWQQMQKEQQSTGSRMIMQGSRDSRQAHMPAAPMRPTIPNVVRSTTAPIVPPQINGMQHNGAIPPIHSAFNLRHELSAQLSHMDGFCKTGADIRLAWFENDCSKMVPYSHEYILLAMQRSLGRGDNLVLVALNLKSLPPPTSSSQALSAQCVGCGEKSIHTFPQLAAHLGVELAADCRLNSSQLVGTYARFYLVRDSNNPHKLIRGSPSWHKTNEAERMRVLNSTPAATSSTPLIRGSMIMVSPPQRNNATSGPAQDALVLTQPQASSLYAAASRPHLKRALSSPAPKNQVEPGKRQFSSYSQDEVVVIHDDPTPKRYHCEGKENLRSIKIPDNFSSQHERKPIIAFLYPATNLPHFIGDLTSVIITSQFSECFKPLSQEAKDRLKLSQHCSLTYSKLMLLATVQYLVNLGVDTNLSSEGLSSYLMPFLKIFSEEKGPCLAKIQFSQIFAFCQITAAASQGLVEIIYCKTSIADGISECLKNYHSSLNKYQVLVYARENSNEEVTFHLFVSGNISRSIEESLGSRDDLTALVSQGLVSLQYSQLRVSLSDVAKQCYHNRSTSKLKSFNEQSSVMSKCKCSRRQNEVSTIASHLFTTVEKIFNDSSELELRDFTSLRFLFLLPPSSSLLSETVNCISESKILSEIYKTSLPVSALSSQVVAAMEDGSLQRILSICKQWENSSTLLFLIQLDAHLCNTIKISDWLNSSAVMKSKNIFVVQCTSHPYPLLTSNSRIPTSNLVYCGDEKDKLPSAYNLGTRSKCYCPSSSVFDPVYERQRERLCANYQLLHSSLIICEILTHQYIASLAVMSSTNGARNEKFNCSSNNILSPVISQVIRDLLDGAIIIIRVTSSILATRFYDNVKHAQDRLGLNETFQVLLCRGSASTPTISLSKYFLDILQTRHNSDRDWLPTCLEDLSGIPCFIVYAGDQLISQTMPKTLKYVDYRMAFHGKLSRSQVEEELALSAPLCFPTPNEEADAPVENGDNSVDNHVSEPHSNSQHNHNNSDHFDESKNANNNWIPAYKKPENGYRNNDESYDEKKREDVLFDFIGLAMKEADLPADENSPNSKCFHVSPIAILPEHIYNLINNKTNLSLTDLDAHPTSRWAEPLHPPLSKYTSTCDQATFYRTWSSPTHQNPDFNNTEHVIHEKRILLVTPPNCLPQQICCHFLGSLYRDLTKALEISVYDDPDGNATEDFPDTFCSLLTNNVSRRMSQIVNSCSDVDKLHRFVTSDPSLAKRSVVVRHCRHALINLKRVKDSSNGVLLNGDTMHHEYVLNISVKEFYHRKDGLNLRIIIPSSQSKKFRFSALEDGNVDLVSLKLKQRDDVGIKTPVISIATHGVKLGLYNIGAGSDSVTHMIIVRARDAETYKLNLPNHVIVVLPEEFDFLGKGAMKFAAQVLFDQFYGNEQELASDRDVTWPFVLLIDDDVVAFSKLRHHRDSHMDNRVSWVDISLLEVLQNFESFARFDADACGFKPWSSHLPITLPHEKQTNVDNWLVKSCVESCIFINCKTANAVKYTYTKFENEDIDWWLRAAAVGLNLYRFENVAMVKKVMEPLKSDLDLGNTQSPLVTTADSEFAPLYFHPALLLEKYLRQCGALMFPSAYGNPDNPVLCVDCYLSLGNQVCVQFVSSESDAKLWATERHRQFGGLILSSPNNNVRPELLEGFQFVDGAVVCVIDTDRNSLRQTVVSLCLETTWHFRLTDEFQTTNHTTLARTHVRPFYFLTGAKKDF